MIDYPVTAASGTLRSDASDAVSFPHRWTSGGVSVESPFTGAHVLHLAIAACVLNDLHREAERLGTPLRGVRVHASGGLDPVTWRSTGITYRVEVDSPASEADIAVLLATVDDVAEIPQTLRAGAPVRRDPTP